MQAMPMSGERRIGRRRLLAGATAGVGGLLLGGCDRPPRRTLLTRILDSAETVNQHVQECIAPHAAIGRRYTDADLSPHFKSNGTHEPSDADYQALARTGSVDWRLEVTGLVERPARPSLAELHAMPSVTQITRHDCVE